MKTFRLATLLLMCLLTSAVQGHTIAYTSFEEPVVPTNSNDAYATTYTDLGDPASDHELVNTAGTHLPVAYTSVGGELGFSAFYSSSHGADGVTEDIVGVGINIPGQTDKILVASHGQQRYLLSDIDGQVTVTLDSVDLTGFVSPQVSFDFFFRSSSYEYVDGNQDFAHVWVEVDDGQTVSEITLLDTRPNDIDDLDLEGFWSSLSTPLPENSVATFKFEANTGSAAEMFGIDNIQFTAVPEPATIALMLISGAASVLLGIRRR